MAAAKAVGRRGRRSDARGTQPAGCPYHRCSPAAGSDLCADLINHCVCHSAVQACEAYIIKRLGPSSETIYVAETAPSASTPTYWMAWLQLADKLGLTRIARHCAAPVVKEMLSGQAQEPMAQLAQLSQQALRALFAVLLKGAKSAESDIRFRVSNYLCSFSVDWNAPENMF